MATGKAFGGPQDGATRELPDDPSEVVEVWGSWFTSREPPVQRGRKVYLYQQDARYRHRLVFIGEDVIWDGEEVKN